MGTQKQDVRWYYCPTCKREMVEAEVAGPTEDVPTRWCPECETDVFSLTDVLVAYIEKLRDGQWQVDVCRDGEIIESFYDFSKAAVVKAVRDAYPGIEIERA